MEREARTPVLVRAPRRPSQRKTLGVSTHTHTGACSTAPRLSHAQSKQLTGRADGADKVTESAEEPRAPAQPGGVSHRRRCWRLGWKALWSWRMPYRREAGMGKGRRHLNVRKFYTVYTTTDRVSSRYPKTGHALRQMVRLDFHLSVCFCSALKVICCSCGLCAAAIGFRGSAPHFHRFGSQRK